MAEDFRMTGEIVEEHQNRMKHIRRYYPFFKLAEGAFGQFKEGRYAKLDMGYLTMAVLRFLIEENNFREKEVVFEDYERFVVQLLRRDFQLQESTEEEHALAVYILDKLQNDGKPFVFGYFDPVEHKKRQFRVRLIETHLVENVIFYSITADGIEFYLDTKEVQEESKISIEQLLLEKMIRSRNFRGGTQVVRRINNEVRKLQIRKNEVLSLLSHDVNEGMRACTEFMEHTTHWFEDEQKLFQKNSELIRLALTKAREEEGEGDYNSPYYRAVSEIYELEGELKKAIARHSELLGACMELQKKADEFVVHAKVHALRHAVYFRGMVSKMMEQDQADRLSCLIEPLFKLNVRKTFPLHMLDELLSFRPEKEEVSEKLEEAAQVQYVYEDEVEEQRIQHNFEGFLAVLFQMLLQQPVVELEEYSSKLSEQGVEASQNGDFYTFLIHLCQKKEYSMRKLQEEKDTFLEETMQKFLQEHAQLSEETQTLCFRIEMDAHQKLQMAEGAELSRLRFVRWED